MDRDSTDDVLERAALDRNSEHNSQSLHGPASDNERAETGADSGLFHTDQALLVTQGNHKFYSLVLPSDLLASTCTVDARLDNPVDGFQRLLDRRRAREIADYIDSGFGTVPSAIILSAQPAAQLQYDRKTGSIRFKRDRRSFLIIDGQHRVFGFNLASRSVKVPVVIYNRLTRGEECRLFMDINTKQRPVPPELLLDIRRLSEIETAAEALLHDVFDLFATQEDSVLSGLLSPSERRKGKISRVTFNAALKSIDDAFVDARARDVYDVLNAYWQACLAGLRLHGAEENLTNSALFKALTMLFMNAAERVSDRHGGSYTVQNFEEVLMPFFRRLKKGDLPRAGLGHLALYENYRRGLSAGFSLKQWLFA
jgi:DGQHR domain-containing protein